MVYLIAGHSKRRICEGGEKREAQGGGISGQESRTSNVLVCFSFEQPGPLSRFSSASRVIVDFRVLEIKFS